MLIDGLSFYMLGIYIDAILSSFENID